MKTILFQGDSITEALRSKEDDANLGIGYPTLIKGELGLEYPNEYIMYNRGIGGNRVIDIYARVKRDIINIKPNVLSILVGVNDVWHDYLTKNGIDADKYFTLYSMMIEEIQATLPNTKIIILEPFCLRECATDNTEEEPEKWIHFSTEVKKRGEKAKQIAEKYHLSFVPLQEKFDDVSKLAPNAYWLRDGVHPTTMGHELIKREWLKCFWGL